MPQVSELARMPPSTDALWRALESLERRIRTPAFPAAHRDTIWFEDWQARLNRVERIRGAIFLSGSITGHLVAERLTGIDISMVSEILISACKDVALVWGGSVLLGGAAGGAIGFFGFGVGAIPGAVAGAGVGTQVGAWVLGMLGLKALVEDLGTAIPQALRHYEEGFRLAWGPVRRWASDPGSERAPHELAQGHVVLTIAMLSALTAYLTRGRGDPGAKASILQEIRESPRLGAKVADWVIANEDRLRAHPALRPKQQQVTMASAASKDTSQPATPSQLRRRNDDTTSNGTHPSARTLAEPRGGLAAEAPSTTGTSRPAINHLSNSSAPDVRQALASQAADLRSSLPAELRGRGNVAHARIDVDSLPDTKSMKAYSGFQNGEQGFAPLPTGETMLKAMNVSPAMRGGVVDGPNAFPRNVDGEFKILENVAQALGNNPAAKGRIDLFTELDACTSCGGAVVQFRQLYPNIQLNVFTGRP
jgi:hypothetical protein